VGDSRGAECRVGLISRDFSTQKCECEQSEMRNADYYVFSSYSRTVDKG
jgi:hypothetical protein